MVVQYSLFSVKVDTMKIEEALIVSGGINETIEKNRLLSDGARGGGASASLRC